MSARNDLREGSALLSTKLREVLIACALVAALVLAVKEVPLDILGGLIGDVESTMPGSNPACAPVNLRRADNDVSLLGRIRRPAPPSLQPEKAVEARVSRVVDGDTLVVNINGREARVRLIGIDTPETVAPGRPVECFGPEASAFTNDQIQRAGRRVLLEKDVSETDRNGRLLRYVWLLDERGPRLLNYELVTRGYALAISYPPDVRYQESFRAAQREARDERRGLWAN